jgi:hypothetical protein
LSPKCYAVWQGVSTNLCLVSRMQNCRIIPPTVAVSLRIGRPRNGNPLLQHLDAFGGCGWKRTVAGSKIIKGTGSKARGISMETQPINVDGVRLVDLALSPNQRPASTISQKKHTRKRGRIKRRAGTIDQRRQPQPQRQFMTNYYTTVSHSVNFSKSLQFIAELPC